MRCRYQRESIHPRSQGFVRQYEPKVWRLSWQTRPVLGEDGPCYLCSVKVAKAGVINRSLKAATMESIEEKGTRERELPSTKAMTEPRSGHILSCRRQRDRRERRLKASDDAEGCDRQGVQKGKCQGAQKGADRQKTREGGSRPTAPRGRCARDVRSAEGKVPGGTDVGR